MEIAVIGLNHKTAPTEIREKVAFADTKKIEIINTLLDSGIDEVILLSTCNRTEFYISVSEKKILEAVNKVLCCYEEYLGREQRGYLYVKRSEEAIYHLYKVAAGLDSIVLGEDQILGQVKDAQELALNIGSSKKVLNKFFREAVYTAKKIKTELKISEHPLSVSSIGVKFIKEKIKGFHGKNVFIIGLGKMGRLALKYIMDESPNKIYMANRNHQKVIDLSAECPQVEPVDYKDRYRILEEADILITATSSPHTIIKAEEVSARRKSLYILDLAIPRDVDTRVSELKEVHLYNVDDLKSISDYNERLRNELSERAYEIIKADITNFRTWLSSVHIDPVIKSLKDKCSIIEEDTLQYIFGKVELDGRDRKVVEKMIGSALKRLIREPILKLKEIEDGSKRELYAKVLEELFNIDQV